jgi:hypothetical protein
VIKRLKERFLMGLSKRMPRSLVYWCAIRLLSTGCLADISARLFRN